MTNEAKSSINQILAALIIPPFLFLLLGIIHPLFGYSPKDKAQVFSNVL